ncbi:hypothetical protein GGR57DRAFT_489772 [Xylariaceae sp. FL1272]|nr:hypothetical protein GGR57DRAFT_489772 [Xylariaceae sp. FL1272]
MKPRTLLTGSLAATTHAAALASPIAPSSEIARSRAPQIFNAVHNSMRQWGSSLHHNGMSFFLATVPKGVLFHHGNSSPESPTEPDWLAYEIEHAEGFARGRRGFPPGGPGDGGQKPMWDGEDDDEAHGYLHVYRTVRPMKYIYVDGMGGGKTSMGTLDAQDFLLRGKTPNDTESSPWTRRRNDDEKPPKGPRGGGPMDERARAVELCEVTRQWGLDGIIRMEAGFEIIQCDFSNGLEQVQVLQRPGSGGRPERGFGFEGLEKLRGLSARYHGIGSTRTIVDYSSMVSAFWFPVNLTNPDPKRDDLPRLYSVPQDELAVIKEYVGKMVSERRDEEIRTVDWQDVADIIVARYGDRLKYMAEGVDSLELMASEVAFLTTVFVDGEDMQNTEKAVDRCTGFYLGSVTPVTASDILIQAAFETTMHAICKALFDIQSLIVEKQAASDTSLHAAVRIMKDLTEYLHWAHFKRCPPCALNEVCAIPMWPFGTVEQYYNPRCSNGSDVGAGESYWGRGPGRGPPHGRPDDGDRKGSFFPGSEL